MFHFNNPPFLWEQSELPLFGTTKKTPNVVSVMMVHQKHVNKMQIFTGENFKEQTNE